MNQPELIGAQQAVSTQIIGLTALKGSQKHADATVKTSMLQQYPVGREYRH